MTEAPIKILVVDDDPALLAVLEAGLQMHGYAVTAIIRPQEALRLIEAQDYDVLVTDYSLGDPQLNGLSLLRAMRQKNESTLVVIITAFASLEITLESIHLGAYDFLTKPFQLDELQLVIRNATRQIELARENQALRDQVAHMAVTLSQIEQQHADLVERFGGIDFDGSGDYTWSAQAMPVDPQMQFETHRRRVRDQIASYVRMGVTIGAQLTEERQRIETLVNKGLLPEGAAARPLPAQPGSDAPPPAPERPPALDPRLHVYRKEDRPR